MIIAVIYATFAVAKRKPEKNSGLYGIRTLDLCDTGATLANWEKVVVTYPLPFMKFYLFMIKKERRCTSKAQFSVINLHQSTVLTIYLA